MEIRPIAHFHSPLKSKFGIPRQSGLVSDLPGRIVFTPDYRQAEAVRGLDDFDFLWLIWEFSENGHKASAQRLTPNNLGLSCVRLDRVEDDSHLGPVIHVRGADLMDGTPIYDIKPYVAYADAHPDARSGFVDREVWRELQVCVPDAVATLFSSADLAVLKATLAQDPRPQYHDDPERVYGMPFLNLDVRFKVLGDVLTVVECVRL